MSDGDCFRRLTYRQTDVLALLALGATAAESARVLGVSVSTVEHDRSRLYEKLDASGAPHVVAVAYETGLLPVQRDRKGRLATLLHRHR